jgi:hypothetical protein
MTHVRVTSTDPDAGAVKAPVHALPVEKAAIVVELTVSWVCPAGA